MKTTLNELCDLFKLRNDDYRSIKKSLVNKISIINHNDVLIKNDELEKLIIEFRNGGSLDLNDVCDKYKISKSTLNHLIKEQTLSFFQLISNKGSKILFLKSELEKENEILLIHSKSIKQHKPNGLLHTSLLNSIVSDNLLSKRDFNMYDMYYNRNYTLEAVSHEFDITRERCRQIIQKTNRRIPAIIRRYVSFKEQLDYYKKQYDLSLEKIEILKSKCPCDIEISDELLNKFSIKITDCDLSVRSYNACKAYDIETIGDLAKITKKSLLGYRNVGKKSLTELEELLYKYKLNFKTN